ncbi:MAG: hypothetical protein V7L23_06820 [Nostoc sp.]
MREKGDEGDEGDEGEGGDEGGEGGEEASEKLMIIGKGRGQEAEGRREF